MIWTPDTVAQLWMVNSTNDNSNRATPFPLMSKYDGLTFEIVDEPIGRTAEIYTFDADGTVVSGIWVATPKS